MSKDWDIAVFPRRNKVDTEMKYRTIWVCVRSKEKRGIKGDLVFCFFFSFYLKLRE